MKCVILAGGSGDSLWPLSRKNYPKQFMNIKEGRSLLQETVVRNMPFCDEFIIVTKESYRNIVNGQMKAFQSLKYRVVLEAQSKGNRCGNYAWQPVLQPVRTGVCCDG